MPETPELRFEHNGRTYISREHPACAGCAFAGPDGTGLDGSCSAPFDAPDCFLDDIIFVEEGPAVLTLPPCPFCGGEGVLAHEYPDPSTCRWFVRCLSCGAEGGWAKTESGARRLWSMRNGGAENGGWMCKRCGATVNAKDVTFGELHDGCGGEVI